MKVYILGITGGAGRLVAQRLTARKATVAGLARDASTAARLIGAPADLDQGELADLSVDTLARLMDGADAVVFAAGSNGGQRADTDTIDGAGAVKILRAVEKLRIRLVVISVMPEAWRDRTLSDDEEHYFAVKKQTEVVVAASDADWVILRPSLLTDDRGTGRISFGAAQMHDQISRDDVAATVVALLEQPRIRRRIVEVTSGDTAIQESVDHFADRS